jgi:uncharacterized protein YaiL (DUF2058 family)
MSTLKDQLLKAGLVKKNEVKHTAKKKTPTPPKKSRKKVSEQTLRAQRAMLEKARKDKKLNAQRKADAERKALQAQIRQLVDGSKLDRKDAEISYNFTYKKKVKSIYVTSEQQQQLARDQIVIVCLEGGSFELVPKVAAEKIAQRDPKSVIKNQVEDPQHGEDDPYADYKIPDDLVW